MTKEITKAFILQQIQDKFKLREFMPDSFLFSETVVPVYDVSKHLTTWVSTMMEKSITTTGSIGFFTVPETERWELRRYDIVFMGAGAYTVAGAFISRAGDYVYLDLTAAQTISYHIDLINPVVLEPGDHLNVTVDGYTSTQNLRLYIDYLVEEIR